MLVTAARLDDTAEMPSPPEPARSIWSSRTREARALFARARRAARRGWSKREAARTTLQALRLWPFWPASGYRFVVRLIALSALRPWSWVHRLPFPALRIAALSVFGYNPLYPLRQAVGAYQKTLLRQQAYRQLRSACRLIQKDSEGLELWKTPAGSFWIPGDSGGAHHLCTLLAENWAEVYGGPLHGVRPGDIVLDGGANVGTFTRYALRAGAAQVVAFEPTPQTLVCLRRNLADEIQQGRVIVRESGLWNEPGYLTLCVVPGNCGQNNLTHNQPNSVDGPPVAVTTIDAEVEGLALERVDFIKLDIEGSEQQALLGARQTLSRFQPRLSVATEHTEDPVENSRRVCGTVQTFQPGYRLSYGPCCWPESDFGDLFPEVLYFDPPQRPREQTPATGEPLR